MIEEFTNLYPVKKTIRFRLIPVGKTEENFVNKKLLEEDERRAEKYKRVKPLIDRYHKKFIEDTLNQVDVLDNVLNDYADLYFTRNKSDDDIDAMRYLEMDMRAQIVNRFKQNPDFQYLFKKEMITHLLPDQLLTDQEELDLVAYFDKLATCFKGFNDARKRMYKPDEKTTTIAYRIVNENLPKFLDNVRVFPIIRSALGKEGINKINNSMLMDSDFTVDDYFSVDYFNYVLSESGIEKYNDLLGGYSTESGEKIQGLNELINLYNQSLSKDEKSKRLPKLKPLFKQILSDRDSISYIPEPYKDDDEVLKSLFDFFASDDDDESILSILKRVSTAFKNISSYNTDGIFYDSRNLSDLSVGMLGSGSWGLVKNHWNDYYDSTVSEKKRRSKKYEDNREKEFKRIKSFCLDDLSRLSERKVPDYLSSLICEDIDVINNQYANVVSRITVPYLRDKKLRSNSDDVRLVKSLLDSIKNLKTILNRCGDQEWKITKMKSSMGILFRCSIEFAPLIIFITKCGTI